MELKLNWWSIFEPPVCVLIVPLWNWNFIIQLLIYQNICVLIVPLWNWNLAHDAGRWGGMGVLIVPLWNWNEIGDSIVMCGYRGFNRTFMELKYGCTVWRRNKWSVLIVPLWNWNLFISILAALEMSFNRTFMELKFMYNCFLYFEYKSF